jgi:hypothetical protein
MAITTRVQGTFTYVEKLATVGPAFAATLGGLVSIVAMEIDVKLACCESASLVALHTKFKTTLAADKQSATISLPDLVTKRRKRRKRRISFCRSFAEWRRADAPPQFGSESRDIVFELHIGEHAGSDEIQQVLTGSVTYSTPGASEKAHVDASALKLLRPARSDGSPAINVDVNAQRNRVLTTDALQTAATLADSGNLEGARESLRGAITTIGASPSAKHPLCVEVCVCVCVCVFSRLCRDS